MHRGPCVASPREWSETWGLNGCMSKVFDLDLDIERRKAIMPADFDYYWLAGGACGTEQDRDTSI